MTADEFEKIAIRELLKSEIKIINKAVKMCKKTTAKDSATIKFKNSIKWNILAILEEISEIKEEIEIYQNSMDIERTFARIDKVEPQALVVLPVFAKPVPYPIIEKDNKLRLLS